MKLALFLAAIAQPLQEWTRANRGEFYVAKDPTDPYVMLAGARANSFVVVLSFADAPQTGGDILASEMQNAVADVFVGHPMDLRTDPGAWLFKDQAEGPGAKSLLTLMDEVREVLFEIGFQELNTEPADPQNMGMSSVSLPDGVPLRAYRQQVKWSIRVG